MFLRSGIAVHYRSFAADWELVVYRRDKVEGARLVRRCGKKPPWEREFLCSQRTTEITYACVFDFKGTVPLKWNSTLQLYFYQK